MYCIMYVSEDDSIALQLEQYEIKRDWAINREQSISSRIDVDVNFWNNLT